MLDSEAECGRLMDPPVDSDPQAFRMTERCGRSNCGHNFFRFLYNVVHNFKISA